MIAKQIIDIFKKDKSYFENVEWSSNHDKYEDQDLCFNDGKSMWRYPVCELTDGTLCDNERTKQELASFYRWLGERIELSLNLVRGKTNEELKGETSS